MQLKPVHVAAAVMLFTACSPTILAQNPLLIPGVLEQSTITLNMQVGTYEFNEGVVTETYGVNRPILGPTIIVTQGQTADFTVVNNLPDTTTMHWHGIHLAPEHDGGPYSKIAPGESWNPVFEVMDEAGTYWYHPHLHHMTNHHVSKGLAGMIWVRDAEEQALDLPRTYGIDEFPIVIQTKDFDDEGQIVSPSRADDVLMVNATIEAVLEVPAQVVRLHLLDGSSERVFNLGFEGDETFQMIATEGGLLEAPLSLQRLRMAPGERSEWLLDLSGRQGDTLRIMSFASEFPSAVYGAAQPGMMAGQTMTDYDPNPMNGTDFTVLTLVVTAPTANPVTSIPTTLDLTNGQPWSEAEVDMSRVLNMAPATMGSTALDGDFTINGAAFDMDVINYTVELDDIEIWTINNNSPIGHPFHIHDVQFYILDRDGIAPAPEEAGRKDVVFVPAMTSVRFICKFEDFANPDVPYMYHCHMLVHEDGGMMGSFVVVDPNGVADVDASGASAFSLYPNPTSDQLEIVLDANAVGDVLRVFSLEGRLVLEKEVRTRSMHLNVTDWAPGLYSVQLVGASSSQIQRLLVR